MNTDPDQSNDRTPSPLALAVRTSAIALVGITAAGVTIVARYRNLMQHASWWAITLIPIAIVACCFAYAFLGARIGARRANNILVLLLFTALAIGLFYLSRLTPAR